MEEKLSGIVLGGVNVNENDKILNIFTVESGTISAKIKGVKKAGAKLKFASEPFCFAEFIFLKKGEFRTVINASLIDSFYPVREDIKKYYAGATVLEFIKSFAKENIVSPEFFMAVLSSLKEISYGDYYLSSLTRFLIKGLECAGYALDFSNEKGMTEEVFFDASLGLFLAHPQGKAKKIKKETFLALISAKNEENNDLNYSLSLKLLDYYLEKKTDEKLYSLKELIKIL